MDSKFASAKTVVFIHIPKTAGMSFTRFLESGLQKAASEPPTTQMLRKGLLCGHNYLSSTYPQVKDGYFITFLREPIARTISQYRYMQSPELYPQGWRELYPKAEVEALEFCRSATFSDFIKCSDPKISGHIVNPQTKMLCDYEVPHDNAEASHLSSDHLLASASTNLNTKINFLGISEMFSSSLAMFRQKTGIDGAVARINESPHHEVNVSDLDRERLDVILDTDIKLYNFGLGIFRRSMINWLSKVSTGKN